MTHLTVVFISLLDNTKSFVKRLSEYLKSNQILIYTKSTLKSLTLRLFLLKNLFLAVLPTYLEGGNGIDDGDVEILTNPLGDFIAPINNYKNCFGIIGSGNRNFNHQYLPNG